MTDHHTVELSGTPEAITALAAKLGMPAAYTVIDRIYGPDAELRKAVVIATRRDAA